MDRLRQLAGQRQKMQQELIDAFGKAVGTALHRWAEQQETHLKGLRPMCNGKTAARVFMAYEQPADGPARKLVVKLCPFEDDTGVLREPGRHLEALRLAPDFADRHLVRLAYDPVPVGDDGWVLFQHIAGSRQRGVRPLSVLLDHVVRQRRASGPSNDLRALTSVCRAVVRSLLGDWAPHRVDGMDVSGFLTLNLDGRLESTGSLRRWLESRARDLLDPAQPWISLPGTDLMLPNPVTLVTDPSFTEGLTVWALLGPGHGDEHQDNVLVPTRQVRKASDFWLIDLSRFSPDAPLTRGPVHMLLSIVAACLDDLSMAERNALVPFLIDPTHDPLGVGLPMWLGQVVGAIRNSAQAWADEAGFGEEWEAQTALSLVACALIFTGRRTTPDLHRAWFLRLAAEAGLAYINAHEARRVVDVSPSSERPSHVEPLGEAQSGLRSRELAPSERVSGALHELADGLHVEHRGSPPRPFLHVDMVSTAPRRGDREGEILRPRRVVHPALLQIVDDLAEQVLDEWESAAGRRRLVVPGPVHVRWVKSERPVVGPAADAVGRDGHPSTASSSPAALSPRIDSLEQGDVADLLLVYCSLRPGRLVIVGHPGSGKTAAVIRLVRDLLHYRRGIGDREERAAVAVPVILTPLDWDPMRQPVKEWLVQRLLADYLPLRTAKHGLEMARRLVDEGLVALVLDGLDDMREPARIAALRALDGQARLRMVVVGRSDETVEAAALGHLSAAVAVELQPVENQEAADYLERCSVDPTPPPWKRLADGVRLEPDCPAAQALDSPLMLGLVRDFYPQGGEADQVDELLDTDRFPDRQAVEDHLLGRVLPVAYARRPGEPEPPYSLAQAQRWLAHMARQMHRSGTRDLAWWSVPRHLPTWWRLVGTGLVSGLLSGVLFAGLGWLEGQTRLGFVAGFLLGPGAAVFDDLFVRRDEHRERRELGRWVAIGYVVASLCTGLLTGVLVVGPDRGIMPGAVAGLVVGTAIGVPSVTRAMRVLAFSTRPARARNSISLSPAAYWWQDVQHSAGFGVLAGLLVGLTGALLCVLVNEPLTAVLGVVTVETIFMPFFAFVFSAPAKTTIAAVQLWMQGRCPLRVIRFLEDARERNVLRTAGPVYQFRHARLQDVLAREYAVSEGLPYDPPDRSSGR